MKPAELVRNALGDEQRENVGHILLQTNSLLFQLDVKPMFAYVSIATFF